MAYSDAYPELAGQTPTQRHEVEILIDHLAKNLEGRRVAIDCGANVGTWSAVLAAHFSEVESLEPDDDAFAFLRKNMQRFRNVSCIKVAVMESDCLVTTGPPRPKRQKLTSRIATPDPDGRTKGFALDSISFGSLDLLKLDLEGGELAALRGGARTIARHRPTIISEMNDPAIRDLLFSMGYREETSVGVNAVFVYGKGPA